MNFEEIVKEIVKEEDFNRLLNLFDNLFIINEEKLELKKFRELCEDKDILDVIEKYYRLYEGYLFGRE